MWSLTGHIFSFPKISYSHTFVFFFYSFNFSLSSRFSFFFFHAFLFPSHPIAVSSSSSSPDPSSFFPSFQPRSGHFRPTSHPGHLARPILGTSAPDQCPGAQQLGSLAPRAHAAAARRPPCTSQASPSARTRMPGYAQVELRRSSNVHQARPRCCLGTPSTTHLTASSGQLDWTFDQLGPASNQPKSIPNHLVREWLVYVKPSLLVAFIFGQWLLRSKLPPCRRQLKLRVGTHGSQFR